MSLFLSFCSGFIFSVLKNLHITKGVVSRIVNTWDAIVGRYMYKSGK